MFKLLKVFRIYNPPYTRILNYQQVIHIYVNVLGLRTNFFFLIDFRNANFRNTLFYQ